MQTESCGRHERRQRMSAYVDAKTLQQNAEKEYSVLEEKLKVVLLTVKDRNTLP